MLDGIVHGESKPPRIVLYGPQGIGKSTFGADAEAPVFIPTEDGVDNVPVDRFPKATTWAEVLTNTEKVLKDKHDYKTLVLDTLNGAVELAAQMVCQTQYGGQWVTTKGNGGFLGFAQGWKSTSEEQRKLIVLLDGIRTRGMTIVLLAHTGLMNVRHPVDGEYTKFAPDIDKNVWARWFSWSDIVLHADYEYAVINAAKVGKGRVTSTTTRLMRASGSAAEDAKCRVGYELPDEMPLSWDEFRSRLGRSADTLEEAKALWDVLTKEEAKKALVWLGVDNLEKASLTRMRQLVNRLREKKAAQESAKAATEEVKP